jgi:site-specific DNA-cytosine methylase
MKKFKTLHLFSGIGGGALGFQSANEEYRGLTGEFETICGIDSDPEACEDFRNLTGSRAECIDLFDRQQYMDFHGHKPTEDWTEVMADDLRRMSGGIPDVVFTSPPCKGFSGLLPSKSAKLGKYQALNRLTVRGIQLTLEAFKDDLPALILLENVPRITTRGASLLKEIKQQLEFYGYVISEAYHDCGEIGGLAQHRRRYLLIARNPDKLDSFVYEPTEHEMKTIGDVLDSLPLPGQGGLGKIHDLPRLQWKTWLRLALIPAGGDWRDLEKIDWQKYRITHAARAGAWKVDDWEGQSGAVTGGAGVGRSNGVSAVDDPRFGFKEGTHGAIYRVQKWEETGRTVTGAMRPNNGAPCVSDPRVKAQLYPSGYGVQSWNKASTTIRSAGRVMNAPVSIDDPRINSTPRSGTYGVMKWDQAAKTITGGDIHSGCSAVGDIRIPEDTEQGVFVIVSEDGTWHRPLTTLELLVLQGFPLQLADGALLILSGKSDARWRERIGNAVPVQAAAGIAETMLRSLLAQTKGDWLMAAEPIWVAPFRKEESNGQKKAISSPTRI